MLPRLGSCFDSMSPHHVVWLHYYPLQFHKGFFFFFFFSLGKKRIIGQNKTILKINCCILAAEDLQESFLQKSAALHARAVQNRCLGISVCECVYGGDSTLSPGEAHSGQFKLAEAIFLRSLSLSVSLSSELQCLWAQV